VKGENKMGKGAYVNIYNSAAQDVEVSYSDFDCMYESGKEGSNFEPITGLISSGKSLPPTGKQYIEAKASGLCAFETSTFTMKLKNSNGDTLSFDFKESGNTWRVNRTQTNKGDLRADVLINEDGGQYNISIIVSNNWKTASWMADSASAIENRALNNLVLPGTHDSGTYAVSATSTLAPKQDIPQWVNAVYGLGLVGLVVTETIANWAKTQGYSIKQQLEAGIRYLDLRVVRSSEEYYICHSLYSIHVDELFSNIKSFIEKNPKEIVILDFNHLYVMDTLSDNRPLIEKMIKAFGSKMAPNSLDANHTVKDFWDKDYQIIALYDHEESVKNYQELWPQSQISSPWPNTTSVNVLKSKLDKNLSNRSADQFFVLQGILTPDGGMIAEGFIPFSGNPASLKELTTEVTPNVVNWLKEWESRDLNIVIVDWFEITNYVAIIRQINMI
jgi:hypothetical protein